MTFKYLKATFFGLFLFLIVHLAVVSLWANAVAEELLAEATSSDQAIPLHPRHVRALVRIEDPTFYEHHGLDISNGQGLTTITSVIARNLFLGDHQLDGAAGAAQSFYRGVFDCCKKIDVGRDVMALVLDSHTTKQQQLKIYLDSVYFGSLNGRAVIGFEAAAKAYHGRELSELTDREFYSIMAMPMAPNRYHPLKNPELHAERARRIEAVATGTCEANGLLDLTYEDCAVSD